MKQILWHLFLPLLLTLSLTSCQKENVVEEVNLGPPVKFQVLNKKERAGKDITMDIAVEPSITKEDFENLARYFKNKYKDFANIKIEIYDSPDIYDPEMSLPGDPFKDLMKIQQHLKMEVVREAFGDIKFQWAIFKPRDEEPMSKESGPGTIQ